MFLLCAIALNSSQENWQKNHTGVSQDREPPGMCNTGMSGPRMRLRLRNPQQLCGVVLDRVVRSLQDALNLCLCIFDNQRVVQQAGRARAGGGGHDCAL